MENNINEQFVENIRKAREKENKINHLILYNDEYMNGIVKELMEHEYLLSMGNSKYELLLPYLYRIVNSYAKTNNLCPIIFKNYHIYYLNYNGYIFSVFQENIDGDMQYGCYSNYLALLQIPYFINFNDIKNNKELSVNDISNGLIQRLVNNIHLLNQEGLPLHFINNIVNNVCDELANKQEKQLKK